ncbi:alpha/beta hydrolase [Limimaricola sp.]|uniref:alpha/beta hydrolase n=1 Tax=Limimaricola sp. TaxID=2211665 RepID=UPI0025BC434F|nr:alpha/beta hydrolase [Limimaricola sp.]
MRRVGKPQLRRTRTPEDAARNFDRAARHWFRVPPYTLHLVDDQGAVPLHWISSGPVARGRVILFLHGGAYLSGSPRTHLGLHARLARLTGAEVCAPDYRLLQTAPFPAAFDDACAAWDALMTRGYRPENIVLGGDSAGGGLMLALLAELTRRGTPPAGAFALSPWVDLTLSGDSLRAAPEAILPVERMAEVVQYYLHGAEPADPRASPLFANFAAPPPVLIQVGSEEALRDDATRMATHLRAAGGEVTLEVWPDVPHVWQILDGWLPEARQALIRLADFVQTSLDSVSR